MIQKGERIVWGLVGYSLLRQKNASAVATSPTGEHFLIVFDPPRMAPILEIRGGIKYVDFKTTIPL